MCVSDIHQCLIVLQVGVRSYVNAQAQVSLRLCIARKGNICNHLPRSLAAGLGRLQ